MSWLDYSYPAELSGDGKTLLFDEEGGGGSLDYSKSGGLSYAVYLRKTDGSPAVLLGPGGAIALSPDGKWTIAQTQDSPSQLRLLPTRPGEARALTNDNISHSWAHWFPDGKRILFAGNEPGHGVKLFVYDLATSMSKPISQEGVNGTPLLSLLTDSGSQASARTRRDISTRSAAAIQFRFPDSIPPKSPSPGATTTAPSTSTNRASCPQACIDSTCTAASEHSGSN